MGKQDEGMIVLKKRRKVIGSMQRSCGEDKQNFC